MCVRGPAGLLLIACALAACGLRPQAVESEAPPRAAVVADVPAIDETPPATMGCDPAAVQSLVGEPATPALQARARSGAGADQLRTLAPGQAAGKEYRAGRLNLQLDAGNRVTRAYCG